MHAHMLMYMYAVLCTCVCVCVCVCVRARVCMRVHIQIGAGSKLTDIHGHIDSVAHHFEPPALNRRGENPPRIENSLQYKSSNISFPISSVGIGYRASDCEPRTCKTRVRHCSSEGVGAPLTRDAVSMIPLAFLLGLEASRLQVAERAEELQRAREKAEFLEDSGGSSDLLQNRCLSQPSLAGDASEKKHDPIPRNSNTF